MLWKAKYAFWAYPIKRTSLDSSFFLLAGMENDDWSLSSPFGPQGRSLILKMAVTGKEPVFPTIVELPFQFQIAYIYVRN
jgi:hypothetical protein